MYSLDRRIVAKSLYAYLNSLRKTAIILNVSHSTVSRWLKNQDRKMYTKREGLKVIETIRTSIQIDPFISICKLRQNILSTLNVSVHLVKSKMKHFKLHVRILY